MQGSGCRVQGSGCRVQGSGFRVQGDRGSDDKVDRLGYSRETGQHRSPELVLQKDGYF